MKNKQESFTNQVVKNYFWNFLMIFLGRVGGVIFIAIVARFLLPEKYGIYSLTIAISLLFISLTNRGMNQTLSKYVSEALGKNQKQKASAYYQFIFKIKLFLTLISAALLFILAYPLTFFVFRKPDLLIPLMISSGYIILISFQNFYEYMFYSIKKVKYLTLKEVILQLSKIALVLLFLYLFPRYKILLAFFALIFSSLIAILFLYLTLKKEAGFIFKKSKIKIQKKEIVSFSINMILSGISSVVFAYTDLIVIGIFLAAEYSGYYSAAFALIGGLYGLISLTGILLPVFTQLKDSQLTNAFNQVFKYLSMISLPIIFGTIVLGKFILRVIYGYSYLQAALSLIILSILIFEFPITDSLKSLFYAKNMPKKVVKISFISLFMNITLNILFVLILMAVSTPLSAIAGVAVASVISRLFIFITLSREAKKELSIKYNYRLLVKPIISGAIMMFILLLINSFISNMTIWIGLFEIILGAFIYIIAMFVIKGITKEDLELFKILKPKL